MCLDSKVTLIHVSIYASGFYDTYKEISHRLLSLAKHSLTSLQELIRPLKKNYTIIMYSIA